jgi:hypothetical protein
VAVNFDLEETTKLLDFNDKNGTQHGDKSLLNFKNAKFLSENLSDYPAIAQYFGLVGTKEIAEAKAKQLSRYYTVTMQSFKQFTQTPVVDYFKIRFARDSIQKSIYTLWAFAFNNITSKALSDTYKSRIDSHACKDYFDAFSDDKID